MFHFQTLDVYKCAVAFLPLVIARGSTLACAAVLDAMQVVGLADPRIPEGHALLVRIVSMLTKMIG